MKNIYLSKFYWKLKQRSCPKKAIVALARKMLTIIYILLMNNEVYNEEKYESIKQHHELSKLKRITNEAKKLGFILVPVEAA